MLALAPAATSARGAEHWPTDHWLLRKANDIINFKTVKQIGRREIRSKPVATTIRPYGRWKGGEKKKTEEEGFQR